MNINQNAFSYSLCLMLKDKLTSLEAASKLNKRESICHTRRH